VRVTLRCTVAALLVFGLIAPASASAEDAFTTIGTDSAMDAVTGANLTNLQIGPSADGLELRFGLEGLTPTEAEFDGSLHWTFWVAPAGGGWAHVPMRYRDAKVKDRTYFTVGAEFARSSAPTFQLTEWDKCTRCGDWGAVETYGLSGGYGDGGRYLAIQLPGWLKNPVARSVRAWITAPTATTPRMATTYSSMLTSPSQISP